MAASPRRLEFIHGGGRPFCDHFCGPSGRPFCGPDCRQLALALRVPVADPA